MSKVTISIDENKLEADFNNSNTAKALLEKFPLKLAMINLYSREMTYHFSKFIPAKKLKPVVTKLVMLVIGNLVIVL